jgi:Tfp pilus assembly protein PilP
MKHFLILFLLCGLMVFPAEKESKKIVMELIPSAQKTGADDGKMPNGKRDPFWDLLKQKKPLVESLETLRIEELRLEGIVRMADGKFQALFTSPKNKPYIAKEGQTLSDGKILKITFKAVTFEKIPPAMMPKK